MGRTPDGAAGDGAATPNGQGQAPEPEDLLQGSPSASPEEPAEPLSPAIAKALEEGHGTLAERVALIRKHSPKGQRYDILSEVGSGAMGRVLRVWDRVLQRELALKLVHVASEIPGHGAEQASLDRRTSRFIEEARITGQLDHPGIVPVHELAFDAEGQLYFAMPLVRGLTLRRIFELVRSRDSRWSLRRAMDVLHKVCLTVAFAHSKGVVHRDLKPDNIMVGPFGESYVMDWGLALIQGQSEHASFLGTPGYMAPEQVEAPQSVGPASDVYALGAILYDLLRGATPHQDTLDASGTEFIDWSELMARPPRAISPEALNVPPELVAICQRAMQRDASQRYPDAHAMAADIARWMDGHVVEAHDTANLMRLKKWSLRNRSLAWALGAILLIVPMALVTLLLQQQDKVRGLEEQGYSRSLIHAQLHAREGELPLARKRLDECPDYLRGWEWEHLSYSIDAGAQVLVRDAGAISAVAASHTGDWLACGSETGQIRLFAAGNPSRTLASGGQEVLELAFHPRAPFLVSGTLIGSGKDLRGGVRLWNAIDGSLMREFPEHASAVHGLAISPDGTLLASGDRRGFVQLWDLGTGESRGSFDTSGERISVLAFDRAGVSLLVCTPLKLRRWSLERAEFDQTERILERVIQDCLYSRDGEQLFVASGAQILSLDSESLDILGVLEGHSAQVTSLALDPSGLRLLSGFADGRLELWNLQTSTLDASPVGHGNEVNDVAILRDGLRMLTGSEDDTARIWSPGAQAELVLGQGEAWDPVRRDERGTGRPEALCFDPSGEWLASAVREERLRIWSAKDGSPERTIELTGEAHGVAWGAAGRLVYDMGGANLHVIDLARPGEESLLLGKGSALCAFITHTASGLVLARFNDNTVNLWKLDQAEPLLSFVTEDTYNYSQAFHPSGESFAMGLESGGVELFSSRTGKRIGLLEVDTAQDAAPSSITCLSFSPDGRWLAAGSVDRRILLWDLESGELVQSLAGHDSQVTSVAFSPDSSRLASGSADDTVRLWEPSRGELLLTLSGHQSAILAVSFDPSGLQLASASGDGELRLWRTWDPTR